MQLKPLLSNTGIVARSQNKRTGLSCKVLSLRLFAFSLCSLRFNNFLNGDLMNKRLFGGDSLVKQYYDSIENNSSDK
jgi:hypothetical protein